MKRIINKHMIILFALVASLLLMTTMYAAINSVTGDIRGKVIADKQTGVYITDVQYVSDIDVDLGVSTIKNFKGTFMQNTVKLSSTNTSSEIKYKVTVYNNSDKSYPFLAVLYDEEFYDNPNIIFEISAEGYKIGDIINPHETRDIFIIFKYKDGQIPQNTTLNANLNFKIADPNRMMLALYEYNASTPYLRGNINKDKIETIRFELRKIEPQGTISSFDASEKKDGSIMGYYTDANNDGLYDLTFASNEPIYANVNARYLFQNLTNLKEISFNNFSTLGVKNMFDMFSDCKGLTSLDLSIFDTSQVTVMYGMFYNCSSLTSLDVSNFDTSNVESMATVFSRCSKLTNLDVSNFDTSQVTNIRGMFNSCSSLTNLDVTKFDTSKVTDMGMMFARCSSLTNLDVTKFDTSKVTNMSEMFNSCSSLTNLDVTKLNTSQVTDMNYMFYNCSSLTNLDVSKFDTSKVTDMTSMFDSCSSLTSLDVSKFDTSKVTDMNDMFSACKSLKSLDVSNFDTNKVTDMSGMFYYCTNLEKIYVSEFNPATNTGWTTSAVTISSYMFRNNTKIVGGNGTKYDANHIDKEYARIDKAGEPGYLTDIEYKDGKSPSQLFDQAGTNPEGLHIGDFVNYDAGIWTQEEINEIKTGAKSSLVTANGSTALPNQSYQFGGFTAGGSRNGNATPWIYTDDNQKKCGNYVKDKSTNQPITGWRVFDVEGDRVTLISAGNPEDYYHQWRTDLAYISEYILTGNVNSSWTNGTTESGKYQKRDWSKYVNNSQKAESAIPLTKSRLDNWYTKYTDTPNANTYTEATFQKIYQGTYTKYQSMVDNGSYYWLSAANGSELVCSVDPNYRYVDVNCDYGLGVRLLVSLKSEVRFTPQKLGTKTVTGGNTTAYGGDQTYNVWGIAGTNTGEDKEPPIAGTMTMKLDNANGAEYVNNTTTERNVYIESKNGYDTTGGSGHLMTTYTVVKDGKTYLENQIGPNTLTEPGTYTITVTTTDNAGNVATRGGYVVKKIEAGKSPSQLFDQAGTNPDGLHIGDFINYDAGTWIQEEISEIKTGAKSSLVTANGSTALPTQSYQFGGFTAGSSRNGNATPFSKSYNYVKDKATGQAITGWRVFDVEGDRVTLISAGNPEDYYHPFGENYAYISEYILTGNINSSWTNGATGSAKYQKRDWSKYVNNSQKAQSAIPLTKSRLDSWYTKYTNTPNANTYTDATFRKIYQEPYTKYQNMVENYSYYCLSAAYDGEYVYLVRPYNRLVGYDINVGLGVRLLVSLKSEVKFTPQKLGTKTVTGGRMTQYGGDQTYNVWGIK